MGGADGDRGSDPPETAASPPDAPSDEELPAWLADGTTADGLEDPLDGETGVEDSAATDDAGGPFDDDLGDASDLDVDDLFADVADGSGEIADDVLPSEGEGPEGGDGPNTQDDAQGTTRSDSGTVSVDTSPLADIGSDANATTLELAAGSDADGLDGADAGADVDELASDGQAGSDDPAQASPNLVSKPDAEGFEWAEGVERPPDRDDVFDSVAADTEQDLDDVLDDGLLDDDADDGTADDLAEFLVSGDGEDGDLVGADETSTGGPDETTTLPGPGSTAAEDASTDWDPSAEGATGRQRRLGDDETASDGDAEGRITLVDEASADAETTGDEGGEATAGAEAGADTDAGAAPPADEDAGPVSPGDETEADADDSPGATATDGTQAVDDATGEDEAESLDDGTEDEAEMLDEGTEDEAENPGDATVEDGRESSDEPTAENETETDPRSGGPLTWLRSLLRRLRP